MYKPYLVRASITFYHPQESTCFYLRQSLENDWDTAWKTVNPLGHGFGIQIVAETSRKVYFLKGD